MLSEMVLFLKSQFPHSNLISIYLRVKSKFKTVSSFSDTEGNNIDISTGGFFRLSLCHAFLKVPLRLFLLCNFESVVLNDAVFYRYLETLLFTCDDDTMRPRVLRMEATVLSSTDG
jgi:hypothetical protein